jgi:MFS family permease
MFIFSSYSNKLVLAIGVSIVGLCYGAAFAVFPSAITDIYGLKNFGINYGLMFTGWGLGGIIGPMIAASMFDSVGNYKSAYMLAAILLIISIGIAMTFNMSKEKSLILQKSASQN